MIMNISEGLYFHCVVEDSATEPNDQVHDILDGEVDHFLQSQPQISDQVRVMRSVTASRGAWRSGWIPRCPLLEASSSSGGRG